MSSEKYLIISEWLANIYAKNTGKITQNTAHKEKCTIFLSTFNIQLRGVLRGLNPKDQKALLYHNTIILVI